MYQTISTKLRIPALNPTLIDRPHVHRLLDHGLERRLTLVSAPAGYGKTTSVAVWAHALTARRAAATESEPGAAGAVAWYALDEDDDDLSTFFTRFCAALEGVAPGSMKTVATGLAIQELTHAQYAHSLGEACLALPEPLVCVLDDYHLITTASIHAVLGQLIEYASSRLHLVIITRHDPPLFVSRYRARRQLTEVRVNTLRLSPDETRLLLRTRLTTPPPDEFVTLLQAQTEGWVAGLQLAAVAAQEQDSLDAFIGHFQQNDSAYVMDYLFDEVLRHAHAPIHEFLLKTAFLARFNAELVAHITGIDFMTCRCILDQLHRQNLFVVALDQTQTWVRYHRQFRSMLIGRASFVYTDAEIRSLRLRGAAWLTDHGWVDEALAEYVALAAWDHAAQLVDADRHRLQNAEEWHLLWRRLAQLPNDVTAQHPGLLLGLAWIYQVQDRLAAIPPLVEKAEALLSSGAFQDGTAESLWGEILILRGSWIYPDVSTAERIELVRAALLRLPAPDFAWVRGFAYIQLVYMLVSQGEGELAWRMVQEELGMQGADVGRYVTRLHHALGYVAYHDRPLSQLAEVAAHYQQAAEANDMPMAVAWARIGAAWVHFQRNEAAATFDVLLPLFADLRSCHQLAIHMALSMMVAVSQELGQEATVQQLLAQARNAMTLHTDAGALAELDAKEAYAALLRQDVYSAVTWADAYAATPSATTRVPLAGPGRPTRALVYARIALATGDAARIERAVDLLCAYLAALQPHIGSVHWIQGATLFACCAWRCGRAEEAKDSMRAAVEMATARGYRRLLWEVWPDVSAILRAMVHTGVDAAPAAMLLAEPAAPHVEPALSPPLVLRLKRDPAPLEEPLTEREREILELLAGGLSNKEIAYRLEISPFTVRNHTSSIYNKLRVTTRRQAATQAKFLGLLPAALPKRNGASPTV